MDQILTKDPNIIAMKPTNIEFLKKAYVSGLPAKTAPVGQPIAEGEPVLGVPTPAATEVVPTNAAVLASELAPVATPPVTPVAPAEFTPTVAESTTPVVEPLPVTVPEASVNLDEVDPVLQKLLDANIMIEEAITARLKETKVLDKAPEVAVATPEAVVPVIESIPAPTGVQPTVTPAPVVEAIPAEAVVENKEAVIIPFVPQAQEENIFNQPQGPGLAA